MYRYSVVTKYTAHHSGFIEGTIWYSDYDVFEDDHKIWIWVSKNVEFYVDSDNVEKKWSVKTFDSYFNGFESPKNSEWKKNHM